MEYADFYDIALYGNENWKGSYSPKEVACNAYDYYSNFKKSKTIGLATGLTRQLLKLLENDGSDDATFWYDCIIREVKVM